MTTYNCYAKVSGSKYLGQVEAESAEEAEEKAAELDSNFISFCHHCSSSCEDPEVTEIIVEKE